MKKAFIAIWLLGVMSLSSHGVLSMKWGTARNMKDDPAGFSLGFLAKIYIHNSALPLSSIGFDPTAFGDSETIWQSQLTDRTGWLDIGSAPFSAQPLANKYIYTVIFDSPTMAGATRSIILDGMPTLVPNSGSFGYSTPFAQNDWKTVPEPGTLGLAFMGLGALGLRWLRRK